MPRRAKLPKKAREPKLSHTRRPSGLEVEQWQAQLRRQFGRVQAFKLENIGDEPVFSEFQVTNPQSGGSYRVAIRDTQPGKSFCACPDFATNDLGTCKHIEFVLGRLERKRGGKQALARGCARQVLKPCAIADTLASDQGGGSRDQGGRRYLQNLGHPEESFQSWLAQSPFQQWHICPMTCLATL